MKSKFWLAALAVLMISGSAFADDDDDGGDEAPLSPPLSLEKGNSTLGLRVSQGGGFGGEMLMGLTGEHMITPMIGVGGSLFYGTYRNRYEFSGFRGEWDYTVYALSGFANFHVDLLHVKNLDTYATAGLGHAFVNGKWKTNVGGIDPVTRSDSSPTFFVVYANARYFVNPKWGVTASLGTGTGVVALGADYLF
jgi:opacity protein-like surface antigen